MIIELTDNEIIKLYFIATQMADKYKDSKDPVKAGSINPVFIDLLGFIPPKHIMTFVPGLMAELAIYKAMISLGAADFPKPDFNIYTKKGDNGIDFKYKGLNWQVKCTTIPGLPLQVMRVIQRPDGDHTLPLNFDIAVSCYHKLNTNKVEIKGWIEKDVMLKQGLTQGKKNWKNIEIWQYKLKELSELV